MYHRGSRTSFQDLQARREAEVRARQAEERLQGLFDVYVEKVSWDTVYRYRVYVPHDVILFQTREQGEDYLRAAADRKRA